jgi:hypothetical protein
MVSQRNSRRASSAPSNEGLCIVRVLSMFVVEKRERRCSTLPRNATPLLKGKLEGQRRRIRRNQLKRRQER